MSKLRADGMAELEFAQLNVMVVVDETFSQTLVVRLLEGLGVASVTAAANGADALAKFKAAKARVHLVICDIEMPEMGGFELIRRIRFGAVPSYKEVPVVMLTGKDSDKNAQNARIHRVSGFLVKPPKANTLKNAILHAFEG